MSENYVIVCRTYDAIQADMLGDLLRENGIAARVLGTRHGALIGVGQNILQLHIEVPRSQAGEATDFLEAFFQGDGADLLREAVGTDDADDDDDDDDDDDGDEDDGDEEAAEPDLAAPADDARKALRPLFAAGLALLASAIGGGHLYGRRFHTACLIAAGNVMALASVISLEWRAVATGLAMYVTLLAFDLAGSQVAVRAYNRGVRASPLRQLITGALFLAMAGAIGGLVGPRIPEPEIKPRPEIHVPA
jgi:hypothetical protein